MRPKYLLGVNHHLLFPEGMTDPAAHEASLAEVLAWPEFEVVDLYCAGDAAQRAREVASIRASGKRVVYNSPLYGLYPGCDPNALDPATVRRTRQAALPHLDAAADCRAMAVNISSGATPRPERREEAWRGWIAFLEWFGREAGRRGLRVVIEPFDSSIGKNLLIGPTREAARSVQTVQARGVTNVGLMVDMGHLPIMGESFAEGIGASGPWLWHVHLGSAVIRHPAHPWYGDFHPPIGLAEGEHGPEHLVAFLRELVASGYFDRPEPTLTFEMRPYPGLTERQSVLEWITMLGDAWARLADAQRP